MSNLKNEASYEPPPVLNGHFWLALVGAPQKRFYCMFHSAILCMKLSMQILLWAILCVQGSIYPLRVTKIWL